MITTSKADGLAAEEVAVLKDETPEALKANCWLVATAALVPMAVALLATTRLVAADNTQRDREDMLGRDIRGYERQQQSA